jgi:hypothetical protein
MNFICGVNYKEEYKKRVEIGIIYIKNPYPSPPFDTPVYTSNNFFPPPFWLLLLFNLKTPLYLSFFLLFLSHFPPFSYFSLK